MHRMSEPVGAVVHRNHPDALGTCQTLRDWVVLIRPHIDESAVFDCGDQPAQRLTYPAVSRLLRDHTAPFLGETSFEHAAQLCDNTVSLYVITQYHLSVIA